MTLLISSSFCAAKRRNAIQARSAGRWPDAAADRVDSESVLSRAVGCLLVASSLAGATASGQAPDAQVGPSTPRVTSRIVEVSVVAEDKQGRPVVDLEAEELVLTDGGRPERIVSFSAQPLPSAAATASAARHVHQPSRSGGRRLPVRHRDPVRRPEHPDGPAVVRAAAGPGLPQAGRAREHDGALHAGTRVERPPGPDPRPPAARPGPGAVSRRAVPRDRRRAPRHRGHGARALRVLAGRARDEPDRALRQGPRPADPSVAGGHRQSPGEGAGPKEPRLGLGQLPGLDRPRPRPACPGAPIPARRTSGPRSTGRRGP